MKALIMAAGKGSRISKDIGDVPKSTLPTLDGTPIIRRSVKMMLELGIKPVLCVGYKGDMIRETLEGLPVRYYENPFFSVTNNVASLWFSQEELDGTEDILLLSGDLYYPRSFLERAQEAKGRLVLFGDSSRLADGDFYMYINKDGYLDDYGPKLPPEKRKYEYMGFSKVKADFVPMFAGRVREYVGQERYDTYFEDIIFSFCHADGEKPEIVDVAGDFWREFDFYDDYKLVLEHERMLKDE